MNEDSRDNSRKHCGSWFTKAEKAIRPEELVGELFFHSINNDDQKFILTNIRNGSPLLALVGRETISRGSITLSGISLVFRIPRSLQKIYIERPGSKFEKWSLAYAQGWALKQPVPQKYSADVRNWLDKLSEDPPSPIYNEPISLQDIRYLPPELLIAGVKSSKVTIAEENCWRPVDLSITNAVHNRHGITLDSLQGAIDLYLEHPSAYMPDV